MRPLRTSRRWLCPANGMHWPWVRVVGPLHTAWERGKRCRHENCKSDCFSPMHSCRRGLLTADERVPAGSGWPHPPVHTTGWPWGTRARGGEA